eukprot:COSAG02_NODE_17841_length_976_cov_3.213227_1_plen_170_part_10
MAARSPKTLEELAHRAGIEMGDFTDFKEEDFDLLMTEQSVSATARVKLRKQFREWSPTQLATGNAVTQRGTAQDAEPEPEPSGLQPFVTSVARQKVSRAGGLVNTLDPTSSADLRGRSLSECDADSDLKISAHRATLFFSTSRKDPTSLQEVAVLTRTPATELLENSEEQ